MCAPDSQDSLLCFRVSSESCFILSIAFASFLSCVVLSISKTLELQLLLSCIGKSSVLFHNCSVKQSQLLSRKLEML